MSTHNVYIGPPPHVYGRIRALMVADYGPALGSFITNRLAALVRRIDDPCMSHLRVALSNDPESLRKYEEIRSDGCCGDIDERFPFSRDGTSFEVLIGFNYGH